MCILHHHLDAVKFVGVMGLQLFLVWSQLKFLNGIFMSTVGRWTMVVVGISLNATPLKLLDKFFWYFMGCIVIALLWSLDVHTAAPFSFSVFCWSLGLRLYLTCFNSTRSCGPNFFETDWQVFFVFDIVLLWSVEVFITTPSWFCKFCGSYRTKTILACFNLLDATPKKL